MTARLPAERIDRMRRRADIAWSQAFAAELAGQGYDAARLRLSAWLLDARADKLARDANLPTLIQEQAA